MKRALNNSRMKNEWVKAVYRHTRMHTHTHALTQRLHSYLAVQIRASILWSVFSPAGLLQLAGDSCTNPVLPPSLPPSLYPSSPPCPSLIHDFKSLLPSSPPPPSPHSVYHQSSFQPLWGSGPDWQLRFLALLLPGLGVAGGPAVHIVLLGRPTTRGLIKGGRVRSGVVLCHLRKYFFLCVNATVAAQLGNAANRGTG